MNVAGPASDTQMKACTIATISLMRLDAAPNVGPSFAPGAEWVLHEPLGARPSQAREK